MSTVATADTPVHVFVAGSGKLATELLNGPQQRGDSTRWLPWSSTAPQAGRSIVVHAGSGRELEPITAYCAATGSPLIELATGSVLEGMSLSFPVVLCPNTNILMLKVMHMLELGGHLFRGYHIRFTESHQAQKQSVPGTAVSMARSLGLEAEDIRSVRDPGVQEQSLQIPAAHLARHAFHRVEIDDGSCSVKLETLVVGDSPYVSGVASIVAATRAHKLDNRLYSVGEFIRQGWL